MGPILDALRDIGDGEEDSDNEEEGGNEEEDAELEVILSVSGGPVITAV